MTAEVAILNKAAVALAADSAVTISAGTKEEKIFDTADKLFELCRDNAIGVMIYNEMSFAETPLPSLIKIFRTTCGPFKSVGDAAKKFLAHLDEFGRQAPARVRDESIKSIVVPILDFINARFLEKWNRALEKPLEHIKSHEDLIKFRDTIMDETVAGLQRILAGRDDALFVGKGPILFSERAIALITALVEQLMPRTNSEQRARIVELAKLALKKDALSASLTGIVIAGFGSDELFPTLVSFEIDGMVSDRLKYTQTNFVDIDREGTKASVLPFAQKEMVERFLYGLDEGIQRNIRNFCGGTVTEIRKLIFDQITFDDDDSRAKLLTKAEGAEAAFLAGLDTKAFAEIRSQSRTEIEDMVEFMPKPELATMAEALVNLTSIKRRVSRGMETVGGPIDVAVISQAEGFVWVKRKHYFPAELNARYFQRIQHENRDAHDANKTTSRSSRNSEKAGSPPNAGKRRRNAERSS